jgi:class 3 adenylate cyclase/DNA-binding CsgD family transcriptional regulator/tetratricopeptide (TPR) repeat protein
MLTHGFHTSAREDPFVGREIELEGLSATLRHALRGEPGIAIACGEAGVGKTRLLREFGALARRLEVQVAHGRAVEDSSIPYLPFMGVFEACALGAGAPLDAASTPLSPGAVAGTTTAARAPGDAEHDRLRHFLAITQQIRALASREPALIVLDDLHWADPASLDLLGQLVFEAADRAGRERLPLMIVVAHRPVPASHRLGKLLGQLRRESIAASIELDGLPPSETEAMIRNLGVASASHALVDSVQGVTHGYPLFVQELVHQLRASGLIETVDGYATVRTLPADTALPRDVTAAVGARLAPLGQASLKLLVLAALLGDSFSVDRLARVAGVEGESVVAAIEAGVDQQILVADGTSVRFRHPLIRQALASRATPERQQEIHLQIAQALEAEGGPRATSLEIARHLLAAGARADTEEVVRYARQGADHAFSIFAWSQAARLYAGAAEAAGAARSVPAGELGELHFLAGLSHHHDFDLAPCLEHYGRAMQAFREADDLPGQARTLRHQTRALLSTARTSYGDQLDISQHERVLATLGDREPVIRGFLHEVMSQVLWTARDSKQAEVLARRALALGAEAGDDRLRYHASFALGLAQFQSGRLTEALASYEDSLEYARRTGDPWIESPPMQRLAVIHHSYGRLDAAERLGREACALTGRIAYGAETSFALANLATTALARGQFRQVEEHAREAITIAYRTRYPWAATIALLALASARAFEGRLQDACHAVELLGKPGEVFDEPGAAIQFLVRVWLDLLAVDAAPDDPHDEVRARLPVLVALLAENPFDANAAAAMCVVVELAGALGVQELASVAHDRLVRLAEGGMLLTSGGVFLLPRVLGAISALLGRFDAADAYLAVAEREARAAGADPELGRTLLDRARFFLLRGGPDDPDAAADAARRAGRIFADLGMGPYHARAVRLARSAGAPASSLAAVPSDALHPREIELLERLARGRSHEEIASDLLLHPESVAPLAEQIFTKIDVPGPSLATAYAFAHGIVGHEGAAPPGPLVLMVTDMVGFTSFVERVGDVRARTIIHVHNRAIRRQLSRHQGKEVTHTGDGLMASFVSADAAVGCAVDIQKEFARYSLENPDRPIRVRIGLNAGVVLPEEDRLFGAALNAAVRICGRAGAGEIFLSESVVSMASEGVAAARPLGSFPLKGFADPVPIYELPWRS